MERDPQEKNVEITSQKKMPTAKAPTARQPTPISPEASAPTRPR